MSNTDRAGTLFVSRRFWLFPVLGAGALLMAACTTPVSSPQAIQRLDPAELARIDPDALSPRDALDALYRLKKLGSGA